MQKRPPRVVKDPQWDIAKILISILSIPVECATEADALVIFPGLGETWRVSQALEYWGTTKAQYLLIAGTHIGEETEPIKTLPNLKRVFGIKDTSGIFTQVHTNNTKGQAVWVSEMVERLGIKSIALFAPAYHIPRAYLTILKSLKKKVPMFPVPTKVSPTTVVPETHVQHWTMIPGEMERILKYQEKGDIVSFKEFKNYMNWLWRQ